MSVTTLYDMKPEKNVEQVT